MGADAPVVEQMEGGRRKGVQRVVVLGGGFGGIYTAYHLERAFRREAGVEVVLVSRNNYFLMTPLLFEASSGVLEPRHAVNAVRKMFKSARFVEAEVERVDFEKRLVVTRHAAGGEVYEVEYDQLVLALGGVTNRARIPGSEHALGFKTLGDAIFLRNRLIDLFEQADVEEDEARRRRLLTFVVIGGGLVGTELLGEMTEFMKSLLRNYPRIPRAMVRFIMVEGEDRIMPEMEEELAAYAAEVLRERGVELILAARVGRIERGRIFVHDKDGSNERVIDAETVMLAAGIGPNPLLTDFPLEKAKNGRVVVAGTMRCKQRPEVWALGDCASIPDPGGKPYPPLAQHALREAKVLARNLEAVLRRKGTGADEEGLKLEPFVYRTLGMLASLGDYQGVGRVGPIKIKGFLAWWVWRTYYMMQMTRWERRLRVVLDWTVALFFRNDVVKLDLFGEEHPSAGGGEDKGTG